MKIVAVVLAAGKSTRMGKNKLLLKLGGKKVINHILDTLEASEVDEIIVVLRSYFGEVTDLIKSRQGRIKIAVNERYDGGMTSSLQIGLKQIKNADAALLALGDQPIFNPKFVNNMIDQMRNNKGKTLIISPQYKGKKGHPVLFSKKLFNEILNLKENEIIRDVFHNYSDSLQTLEADRWTILDIDTPQDFVKAERLFNKKYPKKS